MSIASALRAAAASTSTKPDGHADGATPPEVNVRNCNRLGRTANPPRFSIANLFGFRRRR